MEDNSNYPVLNTISENTNISEEEKLSRLKLAKGFSWYDDWHPYCCQTEVPCRSRLDRMKKMPYGFRCAHCGNIVGWSLNRLNESPLNYRRRA